MERVWSQSPDDVNVAPPVRPAAHVGWTEVKKTYEAFWATLDELTVSMDHPAIKIEGNVAWVYGTEQAKRRTKDGRVSGGANFGTSIFVKRNGRWLMVFHQAALMPNSRHKVQNKSVGKFAVTRRAVNRRWRISRRGG